MKIFNPSPTSQPRSGLPRLKHVLKAGCVTSTWPALFLFLGRGVWRFVLCVFRASRQFPAHVPWLWKVEDAFPSAAPRKARTIPGSRPVWEIGSLRPTQGKERSPVSWWPSWKKPHSGFPTPLSLSAFTAPRKQTKKTSWGSTVAQGLGLQIKL